MESEKHMDIKIIVSQEQKHEFDEILENKLIYPVYQPIVSLEDGSILGYEALSRNNREKSSLTISNLFQIAEETEKVWELEALCRQHSLKHAVGKPKGAKLFLNVDPNVIHDEKFKSGLTHKYLEKYNLKPDDIIFEITERSSIENADTFKTTIQHYKEQDFKIAIDDFGEGYAGINRVCAVMPDYIKLDMEIVRNIDKDSIKQTLAENLIRLCREIHVSMIAEGIETEEELKELIRLEVPYGQGYFIKKPHEEMKDISKECKDIINKHKIKNKKYNYEPSFWGYVGLISKPKDTTTANTPTHALYEYVAHNPMVTEICVLNDHEQVIGIYTRAELFEYFSGRFGYDLNSKKTAADLMNRDFLMVDEKTSIEMVSKMALLRSIEHLYDAVVVTADEKYLGVVTVKDLLETAISIQVSRAVDANPLTGLPGNKTIEKRILGCINGEEPFAIIYMDLDNFKAYNDAYGFNNGDMMIKTVVNCMEQCCLNNEFMGHIGGDDFVIICNYWEAEALCSKMIELFSVAIETLYCKTDWENKYIISKNRNGFKEAFPMATISIAGLTNRENNFTNLDDFSQKIAIVKKKCKQVEGNYYSIQ